VDQLNAIWINHRIKHLTSPIQHVRTCYEGPSTNLLYQYVLYTKTSINLSYIKDQSEASKPVSEITCITLSVQISVPVRVLKLSRKMNTVRYSIYSGTVRKPDFVSTGNLIQTGTLIWKLRVYVWLKNLNEMSNGGEHYLFEGDIHPPLSKCPYLGPYHILNKCQWNWMETVNSVDCLLKLMVIGPLSKELLACIFLKWQFPKIVQTHFRDACTYITDEAFNVFTGVCLYTQEISRRRPLLYKLFLGEGLCFISFCDEGVLV